ncbi:hypothetical protein DPMN_123971 [Dreissena polymorpha]|uniref:Uncharacterized protein n=1 Tax=Dreissena polymorpha TaxID=45954 RepID=A0A9D4JVQ6_DREPO|nr:hypothetical protein DPMN_123971 [Dreissena polymorpha]
MVRAKVLLLIGARYFRRQKPGDAADVDDTSAQHAVDSNNRKAKKDQSPDPDADRTLVSANLITPLGY